MLTRPNEQRWAALVFLGKHPTYLWGVVGGEPCSFLVRTLLHAWTATDELVMQAVAPRGRFHGSPGEEGCGRRGVAH